MKKCLSVMAFCLFATSLFAQPVFKTTDAAATPVSPNLQMCPYLMQNTVPVDPDCLLCHPTGIPIGNGGGTAAAAFAGGSAGEVMERVISGG